MTTPTLTTTTERRSLGREQAGIELRADDAGAERFRGLALVYNSRAAIGNPKVWGFFEEFTPGCATRSLAEFDQRMLIDHDTYYLVSRVSAGDLSLADVTRGVEVDSGLDDELSYVKDLKVNVRKRRITGMSIGFRVTPGGSRWEEIQVEEPRPDGKIEVYTADLRVITEIDLIEVSAVTFPAFVDTEADLRAVAAALELRGDYDAVARRAGQAPELAGLLTRIARPSAPGRSVADCDRVIRSLQARYRRLSVPAR